MCAAALQLMEVTGKNQDECMVALHDSNEDVSRAINFLLESTSDMVNGIMSYFITSPAGLLYCEICIFKIGMQDVRQLCITVFN